MKMVGRYGVAKLGISVDRVDQFSGRATISMVAVTADLFLQFWSALTFCPGPNIKITIIDFCLKQTST